MKIQAPMSSWRRPNDDAAYCPQAPLRHHASIPFFSVRAGRNTNPPDVGSRYDYPMGYNDGGTWIMYVKLSFVKVEFHLFFT